MSSQIQRGRLENAETYAVAIAFAVLAGLLIVLLQRNKATSKATVVPIAVDPTPVKKAKKLKPKKGKKLASVVAVEGATHGKDEDTVASMAVFLESAEKAQKASTKKTKKQKRAERKAAEAIVAAAAAAHAASPEDDFGEFTEVKDKAQKSKNAGKASPGEAVAEDKRRNNKPFFKSELRENQPKEEAGSAESKPKPKRPQKPLPVAPKLSDFAAIPSLDAMVNAITAASEKSVVRAATANGNGHGKDEKAAAV